MKISLKRISEIFPVIILAVMIFSGCGNRTDLHRSPKPSLDDKSSFLKQFDVETKTGKKYSVTVTKAMDRLVNIIVVGLGFENSQDTILIRGVDSLESSMLTDLNRDGFEELYFFTRYAGPEAYGIVYAIASMKDKSCERIIVDEMRESLMKPGKSLEGYRGHDSYYVEEDKLVREFPVYVTNNDNNESVSGKRKVFHTLVDGDTCFFLTVTGWEYVK